MLFALDRLIAHAAGERRGLARRRLRVAGVDLALSPRVFGVDAAVCGPCPGGRMVARRRARRRDPFRRGGARGRGVVVAVSADVPAAAIRAAASSEAPSSRSRRSWSNYLATGARVHRWWVPADAAASQAYAFPGVVAMLLVVFAMTRADTRSDARFRMCAVAAVGMRRGVDGAAAGRFIRRCIAPFRCSRRFACLRISRRWCC